MSSAATIPLKSDEPLTSAPSAGPSGQMVAALPMSSSAWIDLPTAARRSGRSIGHLRRQCLVWAGKGLAKQEKRGKGKPIYVIREDADPSFARVKFAEAIGLDLTHLTDAQRETVRFRETILGAWERTIRSAFNLGYSREAATGQFLQLLLLGRMEDELLKGKSIELSRGTLYNWQRRYQAGGRAGLADGRGTAGKPADAPLDDPFLNFIRQAYLHPNKPKLTQCHLFASMEASRHGWKVHSYKTCQRFIDSIPRPQVIRAREGAKAAKDAIDAFIVRSYGDLATNEIWCGDHHRLDVICAASDGKGGTRNVRPWLTAWMDVRSRVLVGWTMFTHDPNADTILRAFCKGAVARGVPLIVQVDNGKDYDSRVLQGVTKKQRRAGANPNGEAWFHATPGQDNPVPEGVDPRIVGAFRSLDVEVKHVWPYHGQSKPIERFFGSVADRFARLFDTYTGGSTDTKPEDLAKHVKNGKAPTLAEVERAFGEWLLADYHHRQHMGDGMLGRTPEQVFVECQAGKKTLPESMIWFACLPRVGPVKVGQAGVTWRGMSWGGFDGDLKNKLWGQKVYLAIDKDDVSRVFLISLEGKLVGEAKGNVRIPFKASDQDVRQAIATKKTATRTTRQYHEQRPHRAMDVQQIVADIAAKRALENNKPAGGGDVPPPSMQPVRTPFDSDFRQIQQAFEMPLKKAVGADSVPLPEKFTYGGLAASTNQDLDDDLPTAGLSFRELMDQRQEEP